MTDLTTIPVTAADGSTTTLAPFAGQVLVGRGATAADMLIF